MYFVFVRKTYCESDGKPVQIPVASGSSWNATRQHCHVRDPKVRHTTPLICTPFLQNPQTKQKLQFSIRAVQPPHKPLQNWSAGPKQTRDHLTVEILVKKKNNHMWSSRLKPTTGCHVPLTMSISQLGA